MKVTLAIARLPGTEDLPLPGYATAGSAGMDLRLAGDTVVLAPGERALLPTGIRVAVPEGFEAQVRPRSGLAARHGIAMVNGPGTIDSDYRGEVCVVLINLGTEPVVLKRGDRIAQMVVAPVARVEWRPCEELPASTRGAGGFGHTGTG